MNNMGVGAALAVLLLFIATAKADKGGVTFWKTQFTMRCPENGTWYDKVKQEIGKDEILTLQYENNKKGPYYCEHGEKQTKYYFYVQGKVCEHCFELDAVLFAVVIFVDVIGTGVVMMIIYRCTKKKSSAGLTRASKSPARSGDHGPPVPSPDYERLNVHTRSQDTYSMVNRTG